MAQTLKRKTRTAGQFLMYKHMAGSNQYLPNMNHSDAWYYLIIIFHKRSSTMMNLCLGKPNWPIHSLSGMCQYAINRNLLDQSLIWEV